MIKMNNCLCCEGKISQVLDWGNMSLANNYNNKEKYPLKLNVCEDCHHLQLDEAVEPEILFKDYPYFSGTSQTSLDFFEKFAETTLRAAPNAKNVLDIACNDGSQLDAYQSLGLLTYGIDPAENLKPVSEAKGHHIMCGMFENITLKNSYDIITAQNVVAHTSTPFEFISKCKEIMHDDSFLFIATSQANMVLGSEFDTVYHEHISYFNTTSMRKLVERAGLILTDVFTHPIHGTSYIFVIKKVNNNPVDLREKLERENGLQNTETYNKWVDSSHHKANLVKDEIDEYRKKGYKIVGCGAAAKGITFLNVTKTKIDVLVDTTPAKWYNSVNDIQILPFESIRGLKDEKVLFVILAWNFEKEITSNIKKFRDNSNDIFITTNQ